MLVAALSRPIGRWGWLKSHPYTVAFTLCALGLAVPFVRKGSSEWEDVYVRAARHLWEGTDIYRLGDGYLYPPFQTLLALPFVPLPHVLTRTVWYALNVLAAAALLRWTWHLSGGGLLQGTTPVPWREHAIVLLGLGCGSYYFFDALAHQQTDLLIAAAVVGGCVDLRAGRALRAATWFGLAAACKCTALLWVPFLLWRGRGVAAVWLIVVAVGANLLPDLVGASPSGSPWLVEWGQRFLGPISRPDCYPGTWGSDPLYNQSLAGGGQRWALTTWAWGGLPTGFVPRPDPVSPATLKAFVYLAELLLVLAAVAAIARHRRTGQAEPLVYAIVLTLMLLLSPMSSKPHFCLLLLPGFCVARAACRPGRPFLAGPLAVAIVAGLLTNKDLSGKTLYDGLLWYGSVTLSTLALLAGCSWTLVRGEEVTRRSASNGGSSLTPPLPFSELP